MKSKLTLGFSREASLPGLVLGLLPASAQNTSTLSTLRPLPCAPTCSKSSWIHSSQGRRAFPRDLSKEEEDETIPATSRPSPSPRGQNPHSLPTASPDDTATPDIYLQMLGHCFSLLDKKLMFFSEV
ncbi:hypothetical protein CapIbe_019965 [Capra ibex]